VYCAIFSWDPSFDDMSSQQSESLIYLTCPNTSFYMHNMGYISQNRSEIDKSVNILFDEINLQQVRISS